MMSNNRPSPKSHVAGHYLPLFLLALFITAYVVYFSWYTINRHNTLNSYMADLSLIDQPMWNTALGPGGFMELTWGTRQQPRLAEHFEPILIPLSLLFWLWDDVRIQLMAQTVALALGALPVFWIAKKQLLIVNCESLTINNSQFTIHNSWGALAFAVVYLLFPHLQAANIADFHADPFVVTPLLLAFWYATQKRWSWLWFWAVIAMSGKETLPTLTAMLGVWLLWQHWTANRRRQTAEIEEVRGRSSVVTHSILLIIVSSAWFIVATFFIVAPLARQYFGTAGPIYLENRYNGGPAELWSLLQDPARWQYLLGLFAAVGFLPLLAPELLILGLPVLVANLLSNFPGQYSGEQHYSAPLVVAFVLAAIYGARRMINRASPHKTNKQPHRTTALIAVLLWLLTWSLAYHSLHGWTPFSRRTETYPTTPAAARLPDFTGQIPAHAVVSASAAIHPHLAHRRVIYTFPTVQEAAYLLVDVTDIPGVHPNDARAKLMDMLNTSWHLLQADHGLILAQKSGPTGIPLPDSFYDFARASTAPSHTARVTFGDGRLQLLGYDVKDDPDDGVTLNFYWQAFGALPENLQVWPLVYNDTGHLLANPTQVPLIAAVWYPPAAWQPGEIIVTKTLPQLLPDVFHVGIAVGPPSAFYDPAQRVPIKRTGSEMRVYPGWWAQIATFQRQGPFLAPQPPVPTLQPLIATTAHFENSFRLTGFRLDTANLRPGVSLPVLLQWQAGQRLPLDYTVFVHLTGADGTRLAQHDSYPTWLTAQPTSQWRPGQTVLDQHPLTLPANLPPGTYTLLVGLYNAQTMERLRLANGHDTLQLAQFEVK